MNKILLTALFSLSISFEIFAQLGSAPADSTNPSSTTAKGDQSSSGLKYGKSTIQFVGDGNLQKTLNQGGNLAANTGLGVLFSRLWNKNEIIQNLHIEFFVNVASTADTLNSVFNNQQILTNRRYFGNYLLTPQNSKQATAFNMDLHFGEVETPSGDDDWSKLKKGAKQIISGISVRFLGSNSNWNYNNKNINVSAFSLKYGVFHEWVGDRDLRFNKEDGGLDYSITAGVYYSHRFLAGDLSFKNNEVLRSDILGSTAKHYRGFEISLGVRLKNIKAEVSIPFLKGGTDDRTVPGLTKTQLITSISFVGGFPIDLNKNKNKNNTPTE